MTVTFYTNKSKRTMVQKELVSPTNFTGTLRDRADVIDPIIEFEISSYDFNLNYAYIPEFNRYYFVTNVVNVRNNLWEVHFHVDVLQTYWDDYKFSPSVISRSETLRVKDLVDNRLWATKDRLTGIKVSSRDPFSRANNPSGVNWVAIVTGITEQIQA